MADEELEPFSSSHLPKRKLSRLKRAVESLPQQSTLRPPLQTVDNRLSTSVLDRSGPVDSKRQADEGLFGAQKGTAEEEDEAKARPSGTSSDKGGNSGNEQSQGDAGRRDSAVGQGQGSASLPGPESPRVSTGEYPVERAAASESGLAEPSGEEDKEGLKEASDRSEAPSNDNKEEYSDEEGELEDYEKRQRTKGYAGEGQSSSDDDSGDEGSAKSGHSMGGSGKEDESQKGDGSQAQSGKRQNRRHSSSKDLNAETQKLLRETAQQDCIGKGAMPEIIPLEGVLSKLKSRVAAAAARAAKQIDRETLPSVLTPKRAGPLAASELEDDDLIIVTDAEDDEAEANAPAARGLMPLRMAIGTETQQEIPVFQVPGLPAETCASGDRRLAEQTASGSPIISRPDASGREASVVPASGQIDDAEDIPANECDSNEDDADTELSNEDEEGSASEDSEPTASTGSDSTSSDSGSGVDEANEGVEELSPGAKEQAFQEARALLRDDTKNSKRRQKYLEDEAEMSEDEGHSDDDEADAAADAEEHDNLLKDLIGFEDERAGDEERRRAIHAEWLADKDDADIKLLIDGMKNGFGKLRDPAFRQEEGGSLADARRRRAALEAEGDSESDDSRGSQSSEEGEVDASPEAVADLTDGESALQRYQQLKLIEASQAEEEVQLDLLDSDSQALLEVLAASQSKSQPPPKPAAAEPMSRFGFGPEVKRGTVMASFLGRAGTAATASVKPSSQKISRSYVFGRDDSNAAPILAPEETGSHRNAKGPTSFAGIKRRNQAMDSQKPSSNGGLLNMLQPDQEQSATHDGPIHCFDLSRILGRPTKHETKRARSK